MLRTKTFLRIQVFALIKEKFKNIFHEYFNITKYIHSHD